MHLVAGCKVALSDFTKSETYARQRIKSSPYNLIHTSSLKKPLLKNSHPKGPTMPKPVHELHPESYRYIQSTIAAVILQIRLREKLFTLEEVCDVIVNETKSMRDLGLEFLRAYAVGSPHLKMEPAQETLANKIPPDISFQPEFGVEVDFKTESEHWFSGPGGSSSTDSESNDPKPKTSEGSD